MKKEDIVDYAEKMAKLYREQHDTEGSKKKAVEAKILKETKSADAIPATYADTEELFAYMVESLISVMGSYYQAIDAKQKVVLRLLRQDNVLSKASYDSAIEQMEAIDKDYEVAKH